jgi:electron transfer flavoprotein alpha subunit
MSILVYTEHRNGSFSKPVFELVSYASALAEMMSCSVTALSIGEVADDELQKLALYGAGKIVKVSDQLFSRFDARTYTELTAQVATAEGARVIVMPGSVTGKAVAPRLSVKMKAAIAPGVNGLPVSTDPFIVNKRVYSGSAFAKMKLSSEVKIVTLLQNSFEIAEKPSEASVETFTPSGIAEPTGIEVVEVQKQEEGKVVLTEALVVISGGRGMKSPDNWQPIIELAELLEGATACSRPVSDEGWRPHDEHTGQTGKIVAPDLYIALGISGATQHLAGVSGSKYIVAINNDKSAPIFESAQYGIVGDVTKVLPGLVEAVRQALGK